MIIGVTGFARHGKDTVGRRLVDRWGYQRFAFADTLKELALYINPWIDTNRARPWVRLSDLVEQVGWDEAKKTPEVRRFLQELGIGVRDIIGEDAWVRALARRIDDEGAVRVVVTDVRFPNEADFTRSEGGTVVRVTRPNFDNGIGTSHPSEKWIPRLGVDYEVVNDGDIADLHERVDAVIGELTCCGECE